MQQFGGKDSKRHFTVVMGDKEHGLYVSSTPSSAAKKAVTKLCAANKKKKVEFCIREITQGSKKKTYGPYLGYVEKLKEPIELEGRIIKYKPVAKLSGKSDSKKGGALFGTSEFNTNKQGNLTPEAKQKMLENFKVENQENPGEFKYKTRSDKKSNTIYFGIDNLLEINNQKYYPFSFLIFDKNPIWRILILKSNLSEGLNMSNSELSDRLSDFMSDFEKYFTKYEINDNYTILVIKNINKENLSEFLYDFNKYIYSVKVTDKLKTSFIKAYAILEKERKKFNIYVRIFEIIKKSINSFYLFIENNVKLEIYTEMYNYFYHKYKLNYNIMRPLLILSKQIDSAIESAKTRKYYTTHNNVFIWEYIMPELGKKFVEKFYNEIKKIGYDDEIKKIDCINCFNINSVQEKIDYRQDFEKKFFKEVIDSVNMKNQEITNDQLIENLLSKLEIKIQDYIKEKLNEIKLPIEEKKIEIKVIDILKNIEDLFTQDQQKFTFEQFCKLYFKLNPYRTEIFSYIYNLYKQLKSQNSNTDDKELIKKIVNENIEKIKELINEQKIYENNRNKRYEEKMEKQRQYIEKLESQARANESAKAWERGQGYGVGRF
jgi:hypothetical protein